MKIKGLLLVLIFGLMFLGCSSSYHIKKAQRICPECFEMDTTITQVVFKLDTVIHLDTTILVLLPRDTAKIDTTIKKLRPYSFKPIYAKNGIINVEVSMNRGVLSVRSHLDSAILYRFEEDIRIKDAIITNLRQVTIKQSITIKEQKTFIERFKTKLQYVLIGLVVFVVLIIIYKLYKTFKK